MKKSTENLLALGMVFAVALALSNVVAAKVVATSVPFPGGTLAFPGAVFCYAITFLVTDVVGELWGEREARAVVRWGFAVQLLAAALLFFTQALPAADAEVQAAYARLLGLNWVFAGSSLAAYALSQSWDVFVFHRLRRAVLKRRPDGRRHRWIWNNVSTATSQLLDTVVFVGLAFGCGLGWLSDLATRPALFSLMLGQYLVKLALAALDTLPFYLLTRERGGSR
ncbi:MAG: queuosine precursor transporter [Kiritimatiellae bacterium]|nr:queuosine precursor transporter [Kiritimatiellia bacterium]